MSCHYRVNEKAGKQFPAYRGPVEIYLLLVKNWQLNVDYFALNNLKTVLLFYL